jgi:hypothetical protein
MDICQAIEKAALNATNRQELWAGIVNDSKGATIAEVGVFRGDFAQHILAQCDTVEKYYMIDPWSHLDDWNKPCNKTSDEFAKVKEEALRKTAFAAGKRVILQGKTTEVSCNLPDHGLDLAYIDGDHTLKGITIDLIRVFPKIRKGGVLGGDDFCSSVWQHESKFEPTLVFPLAVYFAEATGSVIYGLPFNQFAIIVDHSTNATFDFRDLTHTYQSTSLRDALRKSKGGLVKRAFRKIAHLIFGT